VDNYDKLCEAAQLEWTPKVGDRFVVKHALYLEATKDNDIKFTTKKQEISIHIMKKILNM